MSQLKPWAWTLIALAVRGLTLAALIQVVGVDSLGPAFAQVHPGWILLVAVAELATFPAYVLAVGSIAKLTQRLPMNHRTALCVVLAGFGAHDISGGFGSDRKAFIALGGDPDSARTRVGAMSMLEWAVFAPFTCVTALVLLALHSNVAPSLLWPWIVGTPVAVAAAVWVTAPHRVGRLSERRGRPIPVITRLLANLSAVRTVAARPLHYRRAWSGTALYWIAEFCAFYGATRTAGLGLDTWQSFMAYSTGYYASRRSLPLGGAGIAEALLTYALYQLHQPLGPAITAVLIYRGFNFMAVIVPALIAQRSLDRAINPGEPETPHLTAHPTEGSP